MPGPERLTSLRRKQVDRRLAKVREALDVLRPPRGGWVATLRQGLGMTQSDLALRLGVTNAAVSQLEKREREGTASLNSLREAAEALGAELVWAIVPAKPLTETLEERARRLARRMVESVEHTMRLEDQETEEGLEGRIEDIVRELMASPGRLWSLPDAD
ncbi:MAG TPA: mobile mystery protein A [Longimicrobiales bacterium]|nr:mobile mystery protein A [Longimicrobiales bacterium]